MNISETNFNSITKYGYDMNKNVANVVSFASFMQAMGLLVGVPANCFVFYIYTFKNSKGDRFGVVLSSLVDLTASVLGSSFGFALNTNPVNFYGELQCAIMLGSNMLLWNLSGVCMLNVVTYRYILLRYPSFQINNRKRKLLTVTGMLMAIIFSIPSFLFYGETKIGVHFQNVIMSGKMCGASGISDNGTLFQVYPIVVSTVYTFVFLYLSYIEIHSTVLFYKGLAKMEQIPPYFRYQTIAHSAFKTSSNIINRYADKNFSVIDSDALICSSCDKFEIQTKYGTDEKMKSAYEMMLDIDITIPENTNLIDNTPNNLKQSNNSRFQIVSSPRCAMWYLIQAMILFVYALLLCARAKEMFIHTNVWSDISKIEWSWGWLCLGNVLNGVLNPFLHSFFIIFDTVRYHILRYYRRFANL